MGQLLLLCNCILAVQSTNLRQCAKRVSKLIDQEVKLETAYSRLKRFFQTGKPENVLKGIFNLVVRTMCQNKECYLILDRTNWEFGKCKVNLLVIGLLYKNLSWTGKDSLEAVLESDYIVKLCALENESTRAKAEIIYLMTNMDDINQASIFYKKRYKIEVCFKHLKRNGFNLEDQKNSLNGDVKVGC